MVPLSGDLVRTFHRSFLSAVRSFLGVWPTSSGIIATLSAAAIRHGCRVDSCLCRHVGRCTVGSRHKSLHSLSVKQKCRRLVVSRPCLADLLEGKRTNCIPSSLAWGPDARQLYSQRLNGRVFYRWPNCRSGPSNLHLSVWKKSASHCHLVKEVPDLAALWQSPAADRIREIDHQTQSPVVTNDLSRTSEDSVIRCPKGSCMTVTGSSPQSGAGIQTSVDDSSGA